MADYGTQGGNKQTKFLYSNPSIVASQTSGVPNSTFQGIGLYLGSGEAKLVKLLKINEICIAAVYETLPYPLWTREVIKL